MPLYEYTTQKNKGGKYVKRTISAENMKDAAEQLLSQQVPVLEIHLSEEGLPWNQKVARDMKKPWLSLKEQVQFFERMEITQIIGLPQKKALSLVSELTDKPASKKIVDGIAESVSEGQNLHDSMRDSRVFDTLALGLVRAGEQTGKLPEAFGHVKDIYRRNMIVRSKIVGLMTYPAIVIVVAAICIFVLMWKTVPVFVGLFSTSGMALPLPTQLMIAGSNFTTSYPWAVFLGIVLLGVVLWKLPVAYRAAPWCHDFILKFPLIGNIQKRLIQETFVRTFLNLLKADIQYLPALALCRSVSTCYPFKGALARAMIAVSHGNSLMVSLEEEKDIFGLVLVRSLGFGETVGRTEQVLEPLSEAMSRDIVNYIEQMKTILQPFLNLVIGGIVLFVMLAMFLPIFNLPKLI